MSSAVNLHPFLLIPVVWLVNKLFRTYQKKSKKPSHIYRVLFLSFNKTHLSKTYLYIAHSRVIRVHANSTIAKVLSYVILPVTGSGRL